VERMTGRRRTDMTPAFARLLADAADLDESA
jgi:hypothetical protein